MIQKLKISNRLDEAHGLPQPASEDSGLARFADSMNEVDQSLRDSCTPAPEPPPWLHASIMTEVRCEDSDNPSHSLRHGFRASWVWGAVSAVLLVTIWALLTPMPPAGDPGLSAGYAEANELVRTAAAQGAVALTEPFEAELENLSKDLDRTTEFLLAKVP